jgi:hypothetical protein
MEDFSFFRPLGQWKKQRETDLRHLAIEIRFGGVRSEQYDT